METSLFAGYSSGNQVVTADTSDRRGSVGPRVETHPGIKHLASAPLCTRKSRDRHRAGEPELVRDRFAQANDCCGRDLILVPVDVSDDVHVPCRHSEATGATGECLEVC